MARKLMRGGFQGLRGSHEIFVDRTLRALKFLGAEVLWRTPWGGEGCDLGVLFQDGRIYHRD